MGCPVKDVLKFDYTSSNLWITILVFGFVNYLMQLLKNSQKNVREPPTEASASNLPPSPSRPVLTLTQQSLRVSSVLLCTLPSLAGRLTVTFPQNKSQ